MNLGMFVLFVFYVIFCEKTVSSEIIDCVYINNKPDSVELICNSLDQNQTIHTASCFSSLFSLEYSAKSDERSEVKLLKSGDCTLSDLCLRRLTESKSNRINSSQSEQNSTSVSLFTLMPNIMEIDFAFNRITELRLIDFNGAMNVVMMNFSFNNISNVEIGTFSGLQKLKSLDLRNNSIQALHDDLFQSNENLEILHLENNPLKHFNCDGFALNLIPISVYFSWDHFKPNEANCNGFDLKIRNEIIFRENHSENIEFRYAMANFQHLRNFNISGYSLKNPAEIIDFLGQSLKQLDLSANLMPTVNNGTFQKFHELKLLNLSRVNLINFNFNALKFQEQLEILDISNNQLEILDLDSIVLGNLARFDVSGNRLTTLDFNHTNFPRLTFFGVAENEIFCKDLKKFVKQWENLHFLQNEKAKRTYTVGRDCKIGNEINETMVSSEIMEQSTMNTMEMTIKFDDEEHFDVTNAKKQKQLLDIMIILNLIFSTVIIITIIWFCVRRQSKRQQIDVNHATVRFRRRNENDENVYDEIQINGLTI